jgi:hypothetical protein
MVTKGDYGLPISVHPACGVLVFGVLGPLLLLLCLPDCAYMHHAGVAVMYSSSSCRCCRAAGHHSTPFGLIPYLENAVTINRLLWNGVSLNRDCIGQSGITHAYNTKTTAGCRHDMMSGPVGHKLCRLL